MKLGRFAALAAARAAFYASLRPTQAHAQGSVGGHFFPATILTDDPFVGDEMSLPTVIVDRQSQPLIEGDVR
jgi:hypothetical protein